MSSYPVTTVIGLEVHVQLATRSKLFCRCSTAFGASPNTQTCPVCLGLPGALPVMNRHAFQLGLRTAAALDCHIPAMTKWDRKQYYYPDLPKGYQISQYDCPMSAQGYLEIQVRTDGSTSTHTRRVGIIRAHLEEDAGKSMHDEVAGVAESRIDLNRTGTPLLEIVSAPDLRSPEEAKTFLSELKLLLQYLSVSDCNMQEGSFRVDANINLHVDSPQSTIETPIVEVKNMNSFRAVERALTYEARRQWDAWHETGHGKGDVPKQTRGWDDQSEVTRPLRSKEESSDYRYFPDPDLVPVRISPQEIEAARRAVGELPAALRRRLVADYGLSEYDADVLVQQGRELVTYYLQVVDQTGDPKQASNWIQRDVLRSLKERGEAIGVFPVSARMLADMLTRIQQKELDRSRAAEVFQHLVTHGGEVADAVTALGIQRVDDSELTSMCQQLLDANPRIVDDVRQGNAKAVGALIGQAKKRNPNVDPNRVREICLQLITADG